MRVLCSLIIKLLFLTTFQSLGLSSPVLKALTDLGFEKPSAIQAQAIPSLLTEERDLIGLAQTGTGKTAAFGLPLLERMDPEDPSTQALILAPTRELGQQIAQQIELFGKYLPRLNVLAVYGGAAIVNQIKALKKPQHIIIATPGRLIDLIERKAVKLDQLRILVLDEADEMLNMGFKEELDRILSFTPQDKMTWLFSATMAPEIQRMVGAYMHQPIEVRVDAKQSVNTNIEHQYVIVQQRQKTEALKRFIDLDPDLRGIVFCRTKMDTQNLAEALQAAGYQADALHGDLSQALRDRVMKRFKDHQLRLLIATDVAARGIDVNDLTHVFHFALPDDPSYYTHRSGRTARAGKSGLSIALIGPRETSRIQRLQQALNIQVRPTQIPSTGEIAELRLRHWAQAVLDQPIKKKMSAAQFQQVEMLWGNLSREEIIAKVMLREMAQLKLQEGENLNASAEKSSYSDSGKRKGYQGRNKGKTPFRKESKPFRKGGPRKKKY